MTDGPPPRRFRRWIYPLLALWLSVGALECGSYAALRVMGPEPSPVGLRDTDPEWLVNARLAFRNGMFIEDKDCLWRPKPGIRSPTGPRRLWGPNDLVLNSHGHRSPERPAAKPAGTKRVLILGGSHPFGMYVSETEVYSAVLERLLNERGGTWEVLNAASPGHTTWQGAKYLEAHGYAFQPDIVIDDLGMNDNLALSVAYARPDREVGAQPSWWARTVAPTLDDRVWTYRALKRVLAPLRKGDALAVRVSPKDRADAIAIMQGLGATHGFRVLFMAQVGVDQSPGGRAICQVDMADFEPRVEICKLFEAEEKRAHTYFVDTIHATAEGHTMIGKAVFERLVELNWI